MAEACSAGRFIQADNGTRQFNPKLKRMTSINFKTSSPGFNPGISYVVFKARPQQNLPVSSALHVAGLHARRVANL